MSEKKIQMLTVGSFKQGGKFYPPGSAVMVSADDMLANPGCFTKPPKKAAAEDEAVDESKGKSKSKDDGKSGEK